MGIITFFEDKHLYCRGRVTAPRPDLLVPSVTFILQCTGVAAPIRPYMRKALARGRAVHKANELFLRGNLDLSSVDARIMPYFECFLDWLAKHEGQFKRMRPEVVLEGPGGQYAGKADVVAQDGKTDAVIDWKTGEEEPAHLIQGMLYALAQNAARKRGAIPFVVYLWPKKGWKTVTPHDPGALARDALGVLRTFELGRKRHMNRLADDAALAEEGQWE